jgi:NAD(P)-dependent dehydrogenase (short-subunit alcohol dehydrogenase family)
VAIKHFMNKTVVVTGAGSGMGRSYAIEFAKLGARVAITDINADALAETELMLKHLPHKGVLSQVVDVADRHEVFAFADSVRQKLGHAHVIINNAGIGGGGVPVWMMPPEQYERTMAVNFFGVVHGTRAFLPQLLANREGAVVNVSSVFGMVGTPNTSDYCASKFAVRGFTESLMVELEGSPVSVHLVHPGGIRTNIASGVEGGEEFTRRFLKTAPDDIVRYVIRSLQSGEQRIIYGHQSRVLWFLSWAIPLRWRNRFLRRQMREMLDASHYDRVK